MLRFHTLDTFYANSITYLQKASIKLTCAQVQINESLTLYGHFMDAKLVYCMVGLFFFFCSSTVRRWSVHTAACVSVYSGHEAYVYSLVVIE